MSNNIIYFDIIKSSLRKNFPCRGVIRHPLTVNNGDLIDEIAHCNTTITRQDALVVLDLYEQLIKDHLSQGHTVSTGIYRADISMTGGFENVGESFDEKKHKVRVVIRPAKKLSDRLCRGLRFHKSHQGRKTAEINRVQGLKDDQKTGEIRSDAFMEVDGHGLKSYQYDNEYELYLVNEEKRVALKIITTAAGRIRAMIPKDCTPGDYRLELIHAYGNIRRELHYPGVTVL